MSGFKGTGWLREESDDRNPFRLDEENERLRRIAEKAAREDAEDFERRMGISHERRRRRTQRLTE